MRVALLRAAHQVVDARPLVFEDPFAVAIVGAEAMEELRRTPGAARRPHSAAMRAWMAARARFAEDVLHRAAASGEPVQYLVLGAGLDTFCLRNPHSHVRVFEVDHPATQAWKREKLTAAGLAVSSTVQMVPVDFERQGLREQLACAGFGIDVRTVVAWLGVVPYLTAEAFAGTCRFVGGLPPGSEVVFDYGQPREVLPPVEQLMRDSLQARVTQAGEPFQLFFIPGALAGELAACGLRVEEDLGNLELNARFFAGRADGLRVLGSSGRLCRAAAG